MTLVESPAPPAAATMLPSMAAAASMRRSSSPTAVRRYVRGCCVVDVVLPSRLTGDTPAIDRWPPHTHNRSPSPAASPSRRDRDRSGSRSQDHFESKGKENDDRRYDPQHHPNHSHSSPAASSPSCSSSARKRRLDGTPAAAAAAAGASQGDAAGADDDSPPCLPTDLTPAPAPADDADANASAAGSHQRRPRRNSMSHHHDHNRSASPSPSRHENEEEDGPQPEQEPQQQQEEEAAGLARWVPQGEPEGESEGGPSRRSALEDSRVGEDGDNWDVPCGFNEAAKRTLRIEYWDRTRECKERKWDHMDRIDATYDSREAWIWQSVLHEAEVVLEPNMFPYNTPKGIEHWTLWARRELTLPEVEAYVLEWIARERPEVTRWNLDENAQRSIDIYHVHIYFQVGVFLLRVSQPKNRVVSCRDSTHACLTTLCRQTNTHTHTQMVPDAEVGPNPPREPRRRDDDDDDDDEGSYPAEQHPAEGEGEGRDAKRPCRRPGDDEVEGGGGQRCPANNGNGNGDGPTRSSITGGGDAAAAAAAAQEEEQQPAGAVPSPSA